jgi:hypothetical protein
MANPGFGKQHFTRARAYGLEGRPWPLRDVLVAHRMLREAGLAATLAHSRTILLTRLTSRLFDRRLQNRMPQALRRATPLDGMALRTVSGNEAWEAEHCAAIPAVTFRLALRALALDPRAYHFVDIGSGWGYAVTLAAMQPFRQVTGVEFARELHERAAVNLDWARAQGLVRCSAVDLRHESALETQLPDGPLLLFLFNPFGAEILGRFLERVDASMRANRRPIVAVYVHPREAGLFARPGVFEIPLRGPAARGLRLFSPSQVRAWRWAV